MEAVTAKRPPLFSLLLIYLKAGNTTFGGGDPTMLVLRRELGDLRGWLSAAQFGLAYSAARITPGTNVLAFCAGSAYMLSGWVASVGAVIASSAPAAVLVVWLTVLFESSSGNTVAHATVSAILAAVVGMMVASVWMLIKPSMRGMGWLRILAITGGTLLLRELPQWSPLQIMGAAALMGSLWREEEAK
ncbi:MAG TPA: chromate transporter [Bryobacteraceae bacterium]|nr:chromate transporter [Bryobacteraceae bacterium]